jgi:hypothetical protein
MTFFHANEERLLLERTLKLLERLESAVARIERRLSKVTDVCGGVMSQRGDPMALLSIAPGNSPQFEVTPTPAGVTTAAANAVWSSSDTTNAPVTANSADAADLSATVNIPSEAVAGTDFVLTWTYTNADGTTATVTGSYTIVAVVEAVTGGTMAQSV